MINILKIKYLFNYCKYLFIMILLLNFSASDTYATERKPANIAMLLFRGMTRAEEGYLDIIKNSPEFDINVKIFDAAQSIPKLDEIIDKLQKERSNYQVIYVFGTTATQKIMKKIKDTPIVFNIVQRPIEAGIIKDWKSSGNNITGSSNYVTMKSAFKTIGMLMHIHKLGFLYYSKDPSTGYQKTDILQQRRNFGFSMVDLPIESKETISVTIKKLIDEKPEAVMIPADSFIKANGAEIFAALNKHRIPSIVIIPEMVKENGALLALGPDYFILGQMAGENTIEILKGKKPSELSIDRVSQLNLVVNQRTADKLGITIPLQLRRLSEVVR